MLSEIDFMNAVLDGMQDRDARKCAQRDDDAYLVGYTARPVKLSDAALEALDEETPSLSYFI